MQLKYTDSDCRSKKTLSYYGPQIRKQWTAGQSPTTHATTILNTSPDTWLYLNKNQNNQLHKPSIMVKQGVRNNALF